MGVKKNGKKKEKKGSSKKKMSWSNEPDYVEKSITNSNKKKNTTMQHQWKKQKQHFKNKQQQQEALREERSDKYYQNENKHEKTNNNNYNYCNEGNENESSSDEEDEGRLTSTTATYKQFLDTFKVQQEEFMDDDEESIEEEEDMELEAVEEEEPVDEYDTEKEDSDTEPKEEEASSEEDEVVTVPDDENEFDPYRKRYLLVNEEIATEEPLVKVYEPKTAPSSLSFTYMGTKTAVESKSTSAFIPQRVLDKWETNKIGPSDFTPLQSSLAGPMYDYRDVNCYTASRTNITEIRNVYLSHVVNHMTKARDTITRNNERLKKDTTKEYRDQGFVRPRILILTPMRKSGLAIMNTLKSLLPDTIRDIKHEDRFTSEFSLSEEDQENTKVSENKEWNYHFDGNHDDCFQIGMSLSRKVMRMYTDYYRSDIIIASPLGLRIKIGNESEESRDIDFLSSLDMVILDQADVFLMQNWTHVVEIFKAINTQPIKSHDTDFSRVREFELSGQAKSYRQTLLFSSHMDPLLHSLSTRYCSNTYGAVTVRPVSYTGILSNVLPTLQQVFTRFSHGSILTEPSDRFHFFLEHIFTGLVSSGKSHIMIYIPSYFDYVRLRNYCIKNNVSVCYLNEYSSTSQVSTK